MAGNKINTRKKDDKGKSSRNVDPAVEDTEDIDFSLLRKPIQTSVTGFAQARKIFDLATEELKGLLSNECDLLYECKVCRNMFRSLANFISHKRVYCKEQFNSSVHGHFLKETSVMNEVLKIQKLEESYQESLSEKNVTEKSDEEDNLRIPITKDLTSILEKITNKEGVQPSELENKQLVFQKIPKSSVAVFQNVDVGKTKTDTMKAQVEELSDILSQENAVLQSDGSFKVQSNEDVEENSDNVIQISDDDENEEADILKCKICELQFSTLKTLKFHIKYKHLENRLVYPCPDCLDIFSTSWSVYRHLFKVHRKTAAQVRRLREGIQAKAFRMNNPPTYYEKRKTLSKTAPTQKITEEERQFKENQAWLEALDGESAGRRCGGCGRAFERRAALAAHTHTCARRHGRRIQIQIRKDYHKEHNPYLALAGAAHSADTKSNAEDVQAVDIVQDNKDKDIKDTNDDELPEANPPVEDYKKEETEEMETDEPIIQNNKPKFYDSTMINKLPFAQQIEKNNLNAFRQKIQSDVDLLKLLCKKCDVKYDTMADFLNHMSGHFKWVRYACKLCNFKHFNFDKLPEHVKVVHKLKGNTEFYYSTVKAIDATEALDLSESGEEQNEANETSPNSRRPSRCSSDSSRLSDDSSSSSTRPEIGSRKRKSNIYRTNAKKKRENLTTEENDQKEDDILLVEDAVSSKIFEENSSDLDEVEERSSKRRNIGISATVTSRRPVRKKTKPKNADFEYDLSNLLKMEAQGYRDSQTVCSKVVQNKKKAQQELLFNYDIINKDCCGAMITLSRKSVENAQGHMKIASCPVFKTSKESRISNFARPMVPRMLRVDKVSPKKVEELNNISNPSKVAEPSSSITNINKDLALNKNTISDSELDGKNSTDVSNKDIRNVSVSNSEKDKNIVVENDKTSTQTSIGIVKKPKSSIHAKTIDKIIDDLNKEVKDRAVSSSETEKKLMLDNDKNSTQISIGIVKKTKENNQAKKLDTILNELNKDVNDRSIPSSQEDKLNLDSDKCSTQTDISVVIKSKDIIQAKTIETNLNNHDSDSTDRIVSNSEKEKRIFLESLEIVETKKSITEKEKVVGDPLSQLKPDSNSANTKRNINNMVPIKFRRQSLEVIKNPIIKKNITDFTKAGMKTKILVIKPINRKGDGIKNLNTPLKFQTIKLKDPSKTSATNDEKKSDQVVVVQVPKVDCGITRPLQTNSNFNNSVSSTTDSTPIIENEKSVILSNQDQTLDSDEKILFSENTFNVKTQEINSENNLDQDNNTETPNSNENTHNSDTTLCVKSVEKKSEEQLDQGEQTNSEFDHVPSASVNEVNELLVNPYNAVSKDS